MSFTNDHLLLLLRRYTQIT